MAAHPESRPYHPLSGMLYDSPVAEIVAVAPARAEGIVDLTLWARGIHHLWLTDRVHESTLPHSGRTNLTWSLPPSKTQTAAHNTHPACGLHELRGGIHEVIG